MHFQTPEEVSGALAATGYLADRSLAISLFLASRLERPLLLEGHPGTGKTELAKALALASGARLIRLQCYAGIDASQALYDWNFARQMIYIRTVDQRDDASDDTLRHVFGEEFLVRRPLLEALCSDTDVVLLIDEIDRADDEFEAFLLEVLSDFQVTIPELGTITAAQRPLVILTSNRTRELHDALKRRCLYHWMDYPDAGRELEIIIARIPEVARELAAQVCDVTEELRKLGLRKPPGISEALDWTASLDVLGRSEVSAETIEETIGVVLKERGDQELALRHITLRDHGGSDE